MLLSVQQAAQKIGVSARMVNKLINSGHLTATKIGRFWVIEETAIDDYLANRPKRGGKRPGSGRKG
jgi:excisionase family DNA binding protein